MGDNFKIQTINPLRKVQNSYGTKFDALIPHGSSEIVKNDGPLDVLTDFTFFTGVLNTVHFLSFLFMWAPNHDLNRVVAP